MILPIISSAGPSLGLDSALFREKCGCLHTIIANTNTTAESLVGTFQIAGLSNVEAIKILNNDLTVKFPF